jgi:glutamate-1-semialdehyde 2,1-aminomutase
MDCLAPLGGVYQAGTLSGNPLAMAAGIAALEELMEGQAPRVPDQTSVREKSGTRGTHPSNVYAKLEELGAQLEAGMRDAAKSANIPVTFNRCGSMFCGYFTAGPVHNLADAMRSDRTRFAKFFHGMLDSGIYLAPSQFEAGFLSTAHTSEDIEKTVRAAAKVMKTL